MMQDSRIIMCGICFQTMTNPVTLDCKDSFCLSCLSELLMRNGGEGFVCPLCSKPHVEVSTGMLAGMLDTALEDYIARLSQGTYTGRTCQWCEAVEASVQCPQCAGIYCDECSVAVHKAAARRDHVVSPVTAESRNFLQHCRQRGHEEYKAEFYCVQCEQLCCAYCLQIGPHREHRSMHVTRAAAETRAQMTQDLQHLGQCKTRIESDAADLNRVSSLYEGSYDSVENLITERFGQFRQQLMQKELEVRKVLQALRESGDALLTATRRQFLLKLNTVNEGLMRFVCLQNGGSDSEVLDGRAMLGIFRNTDTPTVRGSGFKLSTMGDMSISGLEVRLDLQDSVRHPDGLALNDTTSVDAVNASAAPTMPSVTRLLLSFPEDSDVKSRRTSDGLRLSCSSKLRDDTQIGVRSRETMSEIVKRNRSLRRQVHWFIRLDRVRELFVGVAERTSSSRSAAEPRGFYWKPCAKGVVDGDLGELTRSAQLLPVFKTSDTIALVYDASQQTLSLASPNLQPNVIVILRQVPSNVCACFIFSPGDTVTLLDTDQGY